MATVKREEIKTFKRKAPPKPPAKRPVRKAAAPKPTPKPTPKPKSPLADLMAQDVRRRKTMTGRK